MRGEGIPAALWATMIERKQFYINGKWVDPLAGTDHNVINPTTAEVRGARARAHGRGRAAAAR